MFCLLVSVGVVIVSMHVTVTWRCFVVEWCGNSFACLVGFAVGSAKDCRESAIEERTCDIMLTGWFFGPEC